MKTTNFKTLLIRSSIALAAVVAVWTPSTSWSAESPEGKEVEMEGKMMDKCEEMKEEKMTKHVMGHMEMGKESMSKCPMMEKMEGESDGAHAEHHEKSE